MSNKKIITAFLSTLAFGAVNIAHADDAPAPKKEKKAKKEKGGEKSCSGDKK